LLEFQIEERVNEVLRQLNLLEVQNTYIGGKFTKCISGGQKKRVAIGVELISNPACLILD
jgi:ABC-type multidrug transport system ATPase subunit